MLPIVNGGIAVDAVAKGELGILGAVDLGELHLTLEVLGCLLPLRIQLLAVAAPGCVEVNHPDVF